MPETPAPPSADRARRERRPWSLLLVFGTALAGTLLVTWVLIEMFGRKVESRTRFVELVPVSEISTDPAPWGLNWPYHYEQYAASAEGAVYGGSSAMSASKLEAHPWLARLYAGYAFSLDYREARGHAYMLHDQTATERVTQRPQAGACLHCHASVNVLYRKVGREAMGLPADAEALAAHFDMPAVLRGFAEVSGRPYGEVLAMLQQMPDGTPADGDARDGLPHGAPGSIDGAHPVGCVDCHEPRTMAVRITRPGFVRGIAALAASDASVPFLPSIERWRRGDRSEPYDPNAAATRQELRTFVCAQCHVEYYCGAKDVLEFPWSRGLTADAIEQHWQEKAFPDGSPFLDYRHGETGAPTFKAQHPEFELWSQGVHARAGVSCADCHMPYERQGALKLTNHHVQSPLERVQNACQTCHNVPEQELLDRVAAIQMRTIALTERAATAMTEMLDAILEAKAAGADVAALAPVFDLQRQATWRLDFISSENSRGFHADQEAARILAESIDFSRQAQAAALRLRAPPPPSLEGLEIEPVQGVTPRDR